MLWLLANILQAIYYYTLWFLLQLQKLQQHVDYKYSEKSLRPCLIRLAQLVTAAPLAKQQAVVEKYSSKNFSHISKDPCLCGKLVRELAAVEKSA